MTIDFKIYRRPWQWGRSTALVEMGPGRYRGAHWQDGFAFVSDEVFSLAAGIVKRHFCDYDPYAMVNIEAPAGRAIVADWRRAAASLPSADEQRGAELLGLDEWRYPAPIEANAAAIAAFLGDLADVWESFYASDVHVCVLGL